MWIPWRKTKTPKPASNVASVAGSAESRVQEFLTDYQAQWKHAESLHTRAKQREEVFDVFFPQWRNMTQSIAERHFRLIPS